MYIIYGTVLPFPQQSKNAIVTEVEKILSVSMWHSASTAIGEALHFML